MSELVKVPIVTINDLAQVKEWFCDPRATAPERYMYFEAMYDSLVSFINPWQPISTAPKDGTCILAANKDVWQWCAAWNPVRESWGQNFDDTQTVPTHWMPLPAPPAAED